MVAAVDRAERTVLRRLETDYRRLLELFGFTSVVGYPELARIGLALMRGYVIGAHAGPSQERPGRAYALVVDGAAAPSDPGEWDEARCRGLLDELDGPDLFVTEPVSGDE